MKRIEHRVVAVALAAVLVALGWTGAAQAQEADKPAESAVAVEAPAEAAAAPETSAGSEAPTGQNLLEMDAAAAGIDARLIKDGKLDLDVAVKHFEDLYRSDSSRSDAELTVIRPRNTRTLRMDITTKGEEKALIVITDPPREAGTATLKVDDNLWNYLPRIKRTIRIPPSMMLQPWMGSDFTNDDLVRESSFKEDYVYELTGPSEKPKGWLITFTAKPDIVGLWDRFELVVSPDGTLPIEARYYDRKGRLARTIYWDEVKVFDGKRIPAHMRLVPEDQEGQQTEMRYYTIDFDVDVPDSAFSLSNLEQQR